MTLHEADVIDGYGNEEEREQARRLDTDDRWQDVPWADLDYLIALGYLDAESFRYYLPAYMTPRPHGVAIGPARWSKRLLTPQGSRGFGDPVGFLKSAPAF